MAFDAEAAWDDLQELILGREGWGSKALIAEMAHLRVKHRTEESLYKRFLRLYGDRLVESIEISRQESSTGDGQDPVVRVTTTGAPEIQEDHDDRSLAGSAAHRT